MDPQKRTAINQLLSKVCWMLIMTNLTIFPFMVMRTLFGPQSELVASWIVHGVTFSMLHNCLTLAEMMIFKISVLVLLAKDGNVGRHVGCSIVWAV
jgi:hypothetical protein